MSAPPHTRVGVLGGSMADQALISDLDIYRTAKFLIDRHGVEASIRTNVKRDAGRKIP